MTLSQRAREDLQWVKDHLHDSWGPIRPRTRLYDLHGCQ